MPSGSPQRLQLILGIEIMHSSCSALKQLLALSESLLTVPLSALYLGHAARATR